MLGLTLSDPRILALAAMGLALAALVSAALPARRASLLDPAQVLRSDA